MNHGFLHADRGQWRLAPTFDINPFPERVRKLKTWISENAGSEARIDALMSVIGYFRSPRRARARWREEGCTLGMTDDELDQFVDAFEHDERAAARKLST